MYYSQPCMCRFPTTVPNRNVSSLSGGAHAQGTTVALNDDASDFNRPPLTSTTEYQPRSMLEPLPLLILNPEVGLLDVLDEVAVVIPGGRTLSDLHPGVGGCQHSAFLQNQVFLLDGSFSTDGGHEVD